MSRLMMVHRRREVKEAGGRPCESSASFLSHRPDLWTGLGACPFSTLYWSFLWA